VVRPFNPGMACCAAATAAPCIAMHGANLKTSPLKDLRVWLNPATLGCGARFIGPDPARIVQRSNVWMAIQLD